MGITGCSTWQLGRCVEKKKSGWAATIHPTRESNLDSVENVEHFMSLDDEYHQITKNMYIIDVIWLHLLLGTENLINRMACLYNIQYK